MRIRLTRPGQTLRAVSYTDGVSNQLRVLADPIFPSEIPPTVEPPIIPETSQPPVPEAFQPPGYVQLPFNHLGLPRLQTFQSTGLITVIDRVECFINGVDFSGNVLSFDLLRPISGEASGQCQMTQVSGQVIGEDSIKYRDRFRYRLCWGDFCQDVAHLWVTSAPKFDQRDDGTVVITFRIGDELELFSEDYTTERYCGNDPQTAGETARVFAQTRGMFTRSYPVGHTILERLQDFTGDTPHRFLQDLYQPLDWDVRSNPDGFVTIQPRPGFQNPVSPPNYRTLEPPSGTKPYTHVQVSNQFDVDTGHQTRVEQTRSVKGLESDTRAWFQNGYTETFTATHFLGDTAIYIKETLLGYIPTIQTLTQAQLSADPCSPSSIPTAWGIVRETVTSLSYALHESGSYLVHGRRIWVNGNILEDIPNSQDKELFSGLLAYTEETYVNTPQITQACRKNWTHLQTYRRVQISEREKGVFRLTSDTISQYRGQTLSGTVSTNAQWERLLSSGEWNGDGWVKQPTQTTREDPPVSQWIRPIIERVDARKEVNWQSPFPPHEAQPLNCDSCFTEAQLETAGLRFLREMAGRSQTLLIQVPMNFFVELGQSVVIKGLPYMVAGIEINQTVSEVVKVLTLWRFF